MSKKKASCKLGAREMSVIQGFIQMSKPIIVKSEQKNEWRNSLKTDHQLESFCFVSFYCHQSQTTLWRWQHQFRWHQAHRLLQTWQKLFKSSKSSLTAFRSEKEPETVRVVTKMIIALLFSLAIAVPICQSQPTVLNKVRKAFNAKTHFIKST